MMETANQKKKNNAIMVVIIIAIMIVGIIVVGTIKGWFIGKADSFAVVTRDNGTLNITRSSVSISVDKDTALKKKDKIKTDKTSKATVKAGENSFYMNEKSELDVLTLTENNISFEVVTGEVIVDIVVPDELVKIGIDGWSFTADSSAFLVSVQSGSFSVSVFDGTVCAKKDGKLTEIKAGKRISVVGVESEISDVSISSLNDFALQQLKTINDNRNSVFSNKEIDKLIEERNAATGKDGNAVLNIDGEVVTNGDKGKEINKKATENSNNNAPISEKNTEKSGTKGDNGAKPKSDSSKVTNTTEKNQDSGAKVISCTIEIRCDTILSNMGNLEPGKEGYVPGNGTILPATKVEFFEGESAYDVLKRVCAAYKIQIEASYTPMYDSYYVEGINNLYEFDCGNESGWMYKVNGWFPNYGSSAYILKDGDTMEWHYTCNGLGADVGCDWLGG